MGSVRQVAALQVIPKSSRNEKGEDRPLGSRGTVAANRPSLRCGPVLEAGCSAPPLLLVLPGRIWVSLCRNVGCYRVSTLLGRAASFFVFLQRFQGTGVLLH